MGDGLGGEVGGEVGAVGGINGRKLLARNEQPAEHFDGGLARDDGAETADPKPGLNQPISLVRYLHIVNLVQPQIAVPVPTTDVADGVDTILNRTVCGRLA
jgi:hypothetical protein